MSTMSRRPRAFVPGYPVHIWQRGNNRQVVFRCEADYRYLWRCLKEAIGEHPLHVNGYVFMTNHLHLLVTPDDAEAISKVMHSVTRRYSGYFNARYARTGGLWEGRYKASKITNDAYFLACHRYIDLNPVRARMVQRPGDYTWSSHRCYAHGEANSLVTPHAAILQLGTEAIDRRQAYAALFDSPLDDDTLETIRSCTRSGRAVGDKPRRGRPKKCT
jgi:putative transposase